MKKENPLPAGGCVYFFKIAVTVKLALLKGQSEATFNARAVYTA